MKSATKKKKNQVIKHKNKCGTRRPQCQKQGYLSKTLSTVKTKSKTLHTNLNRYPFQTTVHTQDRKPSSNATQSNATTKTIYSKSNPI